MTDNREFTFDMTLSHSLGHDNEADLVAMDECKAYQLPLRRLLLRNLHTQKQAVVMPEVLAALDRCRVFRTLEDHVSELERTIPALKGQREQARRVLQSMLDQGIMVSAGSLLDDSAVSRRPEDAGRDTGSAVVVVITWERPAALERLLDSVARHGDASVIEALYVIDDSRGSSNREANRRITEEFASGGFVECDYIGREEQKRLLRSIVSNNPQLEGSLDFLAGAERWENDWTSGLARNFALLLSMGRRLVMLDDDVLLEVYEPEHAKGGLGLEEEPLGARFFEKPGNWPGMRRRHETDPVRAHLECLGLPLSATFEKFAGRRIDPAAFAGIEISQGRHLAADPRVLLTQTGSLGDPGTASNSWLIELTGESRSLMLESESSVARALDNDNLWTGRDRAQAKLVSDMSQATGLDNRHSLPPYFPSLRSEDQIYGVMLNYLFPDSTVLDYPWAVPHLPLEPRRRDASGADFGVNPNFPAFFIGWLRTRAAGRLEFAAGGQWTALASCFDDLAGMSEAELCELHSDSMVQSACHALVDLQRALDESDGAPDNWRNYLKRGLEQVNQDLVRCRQGIEIRGFPAGCEGVELIDLWRGHWKAFAQALRDWPAIRAEAEQALSGKPWRKA